MIELTKKGQLKEPATRSELIAEIRRLNSAIDDLIRYLRSADKEAYAGVMEIVKERASDIIS